MNGFVGILYELQVIQAILSIDGHYWHFAYPLEGGSGEIEFGGEIQSGKTAVLSQYFDADVAIASDSDLTVIQCKASDTGDTPGTRARF